MHMKQIVQGAVVEYTGTIVCACHVKIGEVIFDRKICSGKVCNETVISCWVSRFLVRPCVKLQQLRKVGSCVISICFVIGQGTEVC